MEKRRLVCSFIWLSDWWDWFLLIKRFNPLELYQQYFVLWSSFWFYISVIKDGDIAIMQNDYCTEHLDVTRWFLVIRLARNKTHTLQIWTGGIHSQSSFQVHGAEGALRPEQTPWSSSTARVPLFMILELWRDDKVAGNVRWNTFSVGSIEPSFLQEPRSFTNTQHFSSGEKQKLNVVLQDSAARFLSPVNGLESSALQLYTVLIDLSLYIYTCVCIYLYIISYSV